jgi:hypothetical protein
VTTVSVAETLKQIVATDPPRDRPIDPPDADRDAPGPDEQIARLDHEIAQRAKENEAARRLMTIPGVGPMTAVALAALAPRNGAHDAKGTGELRLHTATVAR